MWCFTGFLVESYGNLNQITNKHANQDQHGPNLTCLDSITIIYDKQTSMQLKNQHTNKMLDIKILSSTAHHQKKFKKKNGWKK